VSDTGTATIEPTVTINLTGWESSAVSAPTNISPPTNAGGVPSHTNNASTWRAIHPTIPFLPDDTVEDSQGVEDIAWVSPGPGVTVTVRQARTMSFPPISNGFLESTTTIEHEQLISQWKRLLGLPKHVGSD
jgi:hypothetical protein